MSLREAYFGVNNLVYANTKSGLFVKASSQYLNLGSTADVQFEVGGAWSFDFWMEATTNFSAHHVGVSSGGRGWTLRRHSGRVYLYIYTDVGTFANQYNGSSTVGVWEHFTFTIDAAVAINMYKNGVLKVPNSSTTFPGPTTFKTTADLTIGGGPSTFGQYADTRYDEFNFWNKELSAAEVTELYNAGVPFDLNTHSANANRIHSYRFEDDWTDSVGSLDGTPVNAPTFSADIP